MKTLLELFLAFARVGAMTFGGGYAMIPILEREIVDRHGWESSEKLMDYYAVGQCTPGIIAVNTATFVGSKHKGLFGGVFATLGMVCPSLIIITIIAAALQNFAHIPAVQNAFAGIRVAVCVLILNSVVKLFKNAVKDKMTLLVFLVVGVGAVLLRNVSPVIFILCAALLGVTVRVWLARGKEDKT